MARSTAALLLTLLSIAAPAAALPDSEWRIVHSSNFTVVGDLGEKPLAGVAARLEQFRDVLGRVLHNFSLATPVPTVVIVFGSKQAYEPFGPRYEGRPVQAPGFFRGGADVNYITLTTDGGDGGMRIALHE